jgi:hypothetical protein
MQGLFDVLGVCLAIYTAWAAVTGSVFVRHRAWGRTVLRDDEALYFWAVIAIYGVLAVALIVYF